MNLDKIINEELQSTDSTKVSHDLIWYCVLKHAGFYETLPDVRLGVAKNLLSSYRQKLLPKCHLLQQHPEVQKMEAGDLKRIHMNSEIYIVAGLRTHHPSRPVIPVVIKYEPVLVNAAYARAA